jgi:hypothetical protein
MIKIKLFYLIMPWQIDFALLSYTQLKKSFYYLNKDIEITIDTHLNLSNHIINWDNSQLPKEFFIKKYNDLAILLKDYKHNSIIYDGDENYGLLDMQKIAYGKEFDYYISICPDIYFSEYLLSYLIESVRLVKNKYFVVTPEIHKMWDSTWDSITNKKYMDVPYDKWGDFDIFHLMKDINHPEDERFLETVDKSKWAIWFDIYNKEFYENLCPIHDDWTGYGPWDYYSMLLSDFTKLNNVDFQQYVLRGETILDYSMGDLRDRDFTSYYKDFLSIKIGAKEQRSIFEANLPQYINKGVEQLKEKNIIPKNVYAAFSKAQ